MRTDSRLKFAKRKLNRELDFARFVNQQRETYMSYLSTMTCFQQSFCQKLAQITYDESLSSQMSSSANEDNTQFVWNGVDERNLSLLFWKTFEEGDKTSQRLVSLLRIQAEAERLSKYRKRKRVVNGGAS